MRVCGELRAHEAAFAARAWAWAPWVELSLAGLGLQRTLDLIQRLTARGSSSPSRALDVERARWLVGAAYKLHVVRGRCLPRSLLQYALQRAGGTPVRLVVGVKKGATLEAHAWVEPESACGSTPPDGFERLLVVPPPIAGEARAGA